MKIRPSSLPMLALCPKFQSGGESDDANAGTIRHDIMRRVLSGDDAALYEIVGEDREMVEWAVDFIRATAPTSDHPLILEQKGAFTGPNFEDIEGTPDVVCGPVIYDLKTRWHDYTAQMAAYSLMTDHPHVTVHLLFAALRKRQTLQFTTEKAEEIVDPIIMAAHDPSAKPQINDYCGWCANRLSCSAYTERVNAVVDGREDWTLDNYHSSQITDAEGMGKALKLARELKRWIEAVEHHAKEMHLAGNTPAGFKEMVRQGRQEITDIGVAFAESGMPQEEFLKLCSVSVPELAKAYAELHGMKLAPARREIETKLASVIERGKPSVSLVADKSLTK